MTRIKSVDVATIVVVVQDCVSPVNAKVKGVVPWLYCSIALIVDRYLLRWAGGGVWVGGWLLGWILRMEIWGCVMRSVVGTRSGLFFADGTVCMNCCF